MLVTQAAEVWSLIAAKRNPLWPGWDASKTPILIYLPGKQDLLINHPKPPLGFVPYQGPVRFPGGRMYIKNGPTLIEFDGQNTSMDVSGVQTLVVADTLSNRRQMVESLADQARTTPDLRTALDSSLAPNPMDSMLMFAHEAFHVFQFRAAATKGGNEMALTTYPQLSVENNAGYDLEAQALAQAIRASDPRPMALRWLAIRLSRRSALDEKQIAYEDGTEFNEGLAKYIEWKALETLKGRQPSRDMWLVQGFRGYAESSAEQDRLLSTMKAMMSGKVNINNDPYGASPVRMRLYYSGMAVAALLDRFGGTWKASILQEGTTLTGLAKDAIRPTQRELDQAWQEVSASPEYMQAISTRKQLALDGEVHIQQALAAFDSAPAVVVLDTSALKTPRIGFSFTPFGILRVDDQRRIFRLLPVRGSVNGLSFSEDSARPVLDDRVAHSIVLSLTAAMTEEKLNLAAPGWRNGQASYDELNLPGVTLKKVKGTIRLDGKRVIVALQD
jgi:hypothetical protein